VSVQKPRIHNNPHTAEVVVECSYLHTLILICLCGLMACKGVKFDVGMEGDTALQRMVCSTNSTHGPKIAGWYLLTLEYIGTAREDSCMNTCRCEDIYRYEAHLMQVKKEVAPSLSTRTFGGCVAHVPNRPARLAR
jgi:hypothetical protein